VTCGTVVNMQMWSDSDFAAAYQWVVDDVPYNFTGQVLHMMIRKNPEDSEVFVALDSDPNGFGGIMLNDDMVTFNIIILRDQTKQMEPGDYVQSLILQRPDGLREELWQGTFTYTLGPTRDDPTGPTIYPGEGGGIAASDEQAPQPGRSDLPPSPPPPPLPPPPPYLPPPPPLPLPGKTAEKPQ